MSEPASQSCEVRVWSLVSAVGRIAIGVGMLSTPQLSLRALGFREVSPATAAVGRLAGIRDLVLGVVTLAGMEDPARLRAATLANAAADAGDTLAFAVALGSGERVAGSRGLATALPAALVGLWATWRLS